MTDYSNANVNVPTGVELPSELKINVVLYFASSDLNGAATLIRGNSQNYCSIPKFLCDNYTVFLITNVPTNNDFIFKAKDSSLTKNVRYTIANYVTSNGSLDISVSTNKMASSSTIILNGGLTIKLLKS